MSTLKEIQGDADEVAAIDWLNRFDQAVAADYVAKGELLIEGRDNQFYRKIGEQTGYTYQTLEDFTAHGYGIASSQCNRIIQCCIAFKELVKLAAPNGGSGGVPMPPVVERQMRSLLQAAKFNVEQRMLEGKDGQMRPTQVPVGIANLPELADEWKRVNDAFDKKVSQWKKAKAEAEKKGDRVPLRPKMSSTFINNNIARKYQKTKEVVGKVNFLVRLTHRFEQTREDMKQHGCFKVSDLSQQITKDPAMYDWQLDALKKEVESMRDALDKFREMLEDYE